MKDTKEAQCRENYKREKIDAQENPEGKFGKLKKIKITTGFF